MAGVIHNITNKTYSNTLLLNYKDANNESRNINIFGGETKPVCGQIGSFEYYIVRNSGQAPEKAEEFNDYTVEVTSTSCGGPPPGTSEGTGGSLQNNPADPTPEPTPTASTKFVLRIEHQNAGTYVRKYVVGEKELQPNTDYEYDISSFQNSVDVLPNYDTNYITSKNSIRLQQNGGGMAVYERKEGVSGEANSYYTELPAKIVITFNYQSNVSTNSNNTLNGVVVTLVGPNDSAIAVINNDVVVSLKNGVNTLPTKLQDNVSIRNSGNGFRVKSISVASTIESRVVEATNSTETVSTQFSVTGGLTVNVTSENFQQITAENIPIISFIGESNKEYNTNSNSGVAFSFNKFNGTNRIRVNVNNKEYSFSSLSPTSEDILLISDDAFPSPGQYKVIFTPSNQFGDGNPIEANVNCVQDIWVGVPDIRDIVYPSVLRGPDYVGTDVNFELSYKSVDADFVRIYKLGSTQYIQGPGSGKIQLNVQKILDLDNTISSEDEDKIRITLRLVPYNVSGYQAVTGKEEYITIDFDKGDLLIPRELAMNRIADAFFSQFDTTIFEDETSKYLTHLLHFGEGENKVITTWTGDRGSLIVKLYEPLPANFQLNQQVWISKLQSNPIIETITLTGEGGGYCPPLKGPNFALDNSSGTGFKVYDDLIASGSYTSNDIVNKYLESTGIDTSKLSITYASGSTYLFENFVNFSSAEERVNNFYYKIQLIQGYLAKYLELAAATYSQINESSMLTEISEVVITEDNLFEINYEIAQYFTTVKKEEATNVLNKANTIIRAFDGFEKWLYTDLIYKDSLSYPKTASTNGITGLVTYVPDLATDSSSIAWYESAVTLAAEYDKYNPNYLVNNIPEFIKEDYDNNDFIVFLDMIGQHFDILWVYINALKGNKVLEEKQIKGATNNLVYYLLESMGWEGKRAFDSQFLWEYAFGINKEGFQKYSMSLEDANNQVWRRILNNLPYLLKHKGTSRAMKAIMACYGVPQSLLTIMEFGGPQDPTGNGTTKFTHEDRTAALKLKNSSVIVPWKSINGSYPQGIEFRIKPGLVETTRIISSSQFYLDIVQKTGSFAELKFGLGDNALTSGDYIQTPFLSASVSTTYFPSGYTYALGPDTVSGSRSFPLSTQYYSNILLNRYPLGGESSRYEILLQTSDGQRIITNVSMSFLSQREYWESGSALSVGNNFSGSLDEFRLWRVPLQPSKFENHTLDPNSINGNSYTASTADLLFRLDFEYPKDRTKPENNGIINVAINETYGENYATASNQYSASTYPYQYEPYDRTITSTVPSLGFSYSNKVRFEEQTLVGDLSHKTRATKKAFDRAPIDSNRLGIFMSPIKELNMDIVRAFGDFNIDNYIGDPSDDYKTEYKELSDLRKYYFQRLNRNINEYIQLVRYIDKSLFDVLDDLAPARAKVSKGLLIEPHYLERSKTKWDKPISEKGDYATSIDASQDNKIELSYDVKNAEIDATDVTEFVVDTPFYDSQINAEDVYEIVADNPNYDTTINTTDTTLIEPSYPTYPPTGSVNIDCNLGSTLLAEVDTFKTTIVGVDPLSIQNAGFGLYANRGNAIVRKIEPIFGNFETTGSRKSVFLVKEQYTTKISTQTAGYPVNGALPGDQVKYEDISVTNYRYKVTQLPFSGSVSVGNDTVEVTAINGYLPSHYRYVNNLSEGLQRSYFKGSTQTSGSTPDGLAAVETFTTNPNILKVSKAGRGSGEPILIVE